ncbi:Cytochrome P450 [Mycena indigotica]|uniref:Cytochrome P450 n=1 Tax=Mycena indigotica TaxID=2126181 RepID=A0A8H6SJ90_9AGAR|nr:Cytochrome P450 [Mycena indigotica]KAF7298855.1 Cytochrome P450 [Mycena indigotica]
MLESAHLSTAAIAFATLYLIFYRLQSRKVHSDEPPIIAPAIPFVGHLLGMLFQGGRYIKGIGIRNHDKPIFTLPVPFSRIYIVTDPSLAAAVQRASRVMSFTELVPDITKRVLGLDDTTVAIVRQNLDPEPGDPRGFLADTHDMIYTYLGPGEDLNEMSIGAARELSKQVNEFADQLGEDTKQVDLLIWVRHFVAIATAQFLYGSQNPLALRSELEDAFWDFDHGLGSLLMGVAPSITARKPYLGREALVRAFIEYIDAGNHEKDAAKIIANRVAITRQYGWTTDAAARSEVSFLFAGIVNTATTTFWSVLQLFSRPDLLAAARTELVDSGAVVEEDGKRRIKMDIIKNNCPILLSVFRECLRVGSDNYSTRLVKEDTVLAGKYFLRAGSVVQIAGGVMHANANIWGSDAEAFDHRRFLKGAPTVHPAAFRGFGGGKTLCPGRHFATNEILAFVAMIVSTFELGPVGEKTIQVPEKDDGVLPVHILEPKRPHTAVNSSYEIVGMKPGSVYDCSDQNSNPSLFPPSRVRMPLNIPGILVPLQLIFNPRIALPNLTVKDIRHLDFPALKKAGYRGAVFDKDNCLTIPHRDELVPELQEAWEDCRRTFGDANVLIVSNSAGSRSDAGGIQAESVQRHLQAPVLFHRTPKPGYSCIKAIQRYFSSLHSPIRSDELIIVGDRIFTDVVMANRLRSLNREAESLKSGEISKTNSGGPLAIWTTGVWKREATLMRWCEAKLVDWLCRSATNEAEENTAYIKPWLPPPVPKPKWKFW